MSCPLSYRVNNKKLPCFKSPCDTTRLPQVYFPTKKFLGVPYFNRIRYAEIKSMKRFPGPKPCPTYQPALSFGCVRERSSAALPLRLAFTVGGCACPKYRIPTFISIANDGNTITRIEWRIGSEVVESLEVGENKVVSIAEQEVLTTATVYVTYQPEGEEPITAVFSPVCFRPGVEYYQFTLEEVSTNGCLQVVA